MFYVENVECIVKQTSAFYSYLPSCLWDDLNNRYITLQTLILVPCNVNVLIIEFDTRN